MIGTLVTILKVMALIAGILLLGAIIIGFIETTVKRWWK